MHFEFLVEEASLESALTQILPKILPSTVTFKIHAFRGKDDLICKLPNRLKVIKHGFRLIGKLLF